MVLFFLSLYLTRQLDYSVSAAGRLLTLYGIGSLIGSYLGGYYSDKFGAIRVQIVSLVSAGIGYILLSRLDSVYAIASMLFVLAVLAEAFRPANSTAIAEACPPQLRPRGYALNSLAINLGITIGPAVGGVLAALRYQYIFWVDGITCIMAAVVLLYFFRKNTHRYSGTSGDIETRKSSDFWKDRIFLFVLVLLFFCGLVFVQLFNTWPIHVREVFGISERFIGLYLTLNATMIVLLEMPLIHKIEKYNPLKIIALGSFLLGIGFSLTAIAGSVFYIGVTVVIWTIGEMLVFPLVTAFIAGRSTEKNRGVFMGMYNIAFSLAVVFGPFIGTGIYDYWKPNILWLFCGVLGLITCIGFLYLHVLLKTADHSKI
jgi:predicted MFS family arabinose efflux permease